VVLGVEEVGALQVRVALLFVGIDTGDIHADLDLRFGEVALVELGGAAPLGEFTAHLGKDHVAHAEGDVGVRGVEVVFGVAHGLDVSPATHHGKRRKID
jgi:hypothetical protein